MYKIQDEHQKEHGPLISPVIQQWITMGRAHKDTLVLKTGETEWRPLSSCPEFRSALGLPPAESSADTEAPAIPAPVGSLSGMAVTSLVLGLFGLLGITALAGLILGLLAQARIIRSGGHLRGRGAALGGIILSATMLLLSVPVLGGLFLPYFSQIQAQENEERCLVHLEDLTEALRRLAQAGQNTFPGETNWCNLLAADSPELLSQQSFVCPSKPALKSGYAFNVNLSGIPTAEVAPDTVMIFECNLGWNAAGGPSDIATTRHGMFILVGFAGGAVERVPAYQIPQLRWIP